MDPDARERQRTLDVDMALHLSRARQGSVSVSPVISPLAVCERDDVEPGAHRHHEESTFPTLFPQEERELEIARGATPRPARSDEPYRRALTPDDLRLGLEMGVHRLSQNHEFHHLLGTTLGSTEHHYDGMLPLYQPSAIHGRQTFDFEAMEDFAKAEKKRLGLMNSPADERPQVLRTRKPSQVTVSGDVGFSGGSGTEFRLPAPRNVRERKLSQRNALPRRHGGGKMALFEGLPGAPPASLLTGGIAPPLSVVPSYTGLLTTTNEAAGHDRRQTLRVLFLFQHVERDCSREKSKRTPRRRPVVRRHCRKRRTGLWRAGSGPGLQLHHPFHAKGHEGIITKANGAEVQKHPLLNGADVEGHTWWLDILSPTDEEMKML